MNNKRSPENIRLLVKIFKEKFMKFFLIMIPLMSSVALASTYECNLVVKNSGQEVGTLQAVKAGVGFTMGVLATTKFNERKNIFGTITKWDELQLTGTLQNAGETDPQNSSIKNVLNGKISINSFSRRHGQVASQDITPISGSDNFNIDLRGEQYSVSGDCAIKP